MVLQIWLGAAELLPVTGCTSCQRQTILLLYSAAFGTAPAWVCTLSVQFEVVPGQIASEYLQHFTSPDSNGLAGSGLVCGIAPQCRSAHNCGHYYIQQCYKQNSVERSGATQGLGIFHELISLILGWS